MLIFVIVFLAQVAFIIRFSKKNGCDFKSSNSTYISCPGNIICIKKR